MKRMLCVLSLVCVMVGLVSVAVAQDRPRQERPNAVNAEQVEVRLRELNARMERLRGELSKAREAGREGAVRELSQTLEQTERDRNYVRERLNNMERPQQDRPQQRPEGQRPDGQRPDSPRGDAPRGDGQQPNITPEMVRGLVTSVRELRAEVERLREEVNKLKAEKR